LRSAISVSETRSTYSGGITLRLLVASCVFWAAYDHGSYSLAERSTWGLLLWWLILIGVVGGVAVTRPPLPGLTAIAGLAVLAALQILSVEWSHDADGAFAVLDQTLVYLGVLVVAIALGTRYGLEAPAEGLVIGLSAVALLALLSRFFSSLGGGRTTPLFASLSANRLSFPIDYWNGLAILVALAIPLLLRRSSEPGSLAVRAASAAVLPVITAVIYLASSRGGVAVALTGVVVFFAATSRRWRALASLSVAVVTAGIGLAALRHWSVLVDGPLNSPVAHTQGRHAALVFLAVCSAAAGGQAMLARLEPASPRSHRTVGRLVVVGCLIAAAVALVASHPVTLAERFARAPGAINTTNGFVAGHLLGVNGSGRWQLWTAAVHQWLAHPIAGGGAGSYYRWWLQHGSLTLPARNAHSQYLETLAELGILGLLALLAVLLPPIAAGVQSLRGVPDQQRTLTAALLAAGVGFLVGLSIDWIWQLAAVGGVGLAILGLLASGGRNRVAEPLGRVRAVLIAAASATVCAILVIALLGQLRLDSSQAAAGRSDLSSALGSARAARALAPWSADPLLQLALIYEQAGDLQRARAEIAAALQKDRRDWQLWLVASRIDLKSGDIAASRRSLRHAAFLNPRSTLFAGVKPLPVR
jgi:hypothetical protein